MNFIGGILVWNVCKREEGNCARGKNKEAVSCSLSLTYPTIGRGKVEERKKTHSAPTPLQPKGEAEADSRQRVRKEGRLIKGSKEGGRSLSLRPEISPSKKGSELGWWEKKLCIDWEMKKKRRGRSLQRLAEKGFSFSGSARGIPWGRGRIWEIRPRL